MTAPKLERVYDSENRRWYCFPEDRDNPARHFASITSILSCVVHERLQRWMRETSSVKQEERLSFASGLGTRIHEAVEANLMGRTVPVDSEVRQALDGWLGLRQRHQIVGHEVERFVCSERYGFAGACDIIGEFDGRLVVMDVKSGRYSIKTGHQLSAYAHAYQEETGRELGLVGLRVSPNGEAQAFEYQHLDFCWTSFLATFHIWKSLYYNRLKEQNWSWLNTHLIEPVA